VRDLVVLGTHAGVFAEAHGDRTGDQAGEAGEDHVVYRDPAAAHPGDQRDVGDQAIHRAEHGRPQPTAGDIGMVIRDHRRGQRGS
jgi:hypothetical protein